MKLSSAENGMGRLGRLIRLIQEIKTSPGQKPDQLHRSLNISRSQYFEDRKALAQLGFVFEYDRRKRRYVIKNDPCLPVFGLSASEVFSLVMAVRQLSAAGDHTLTFDAVSAVRKIVANSEKRLRELLLGALDHVVLTRTFQVKPEIIERLRTAQQACERLEVVYDDFSQNGTRRLEVDTYTLYFKGRALYADVYVPAEQKVLMLRLSRIKEILRNVGPFAVREDYNFGERHRHSFRVFTSDQPPQLVRIRFDARTARYIREAHWHSSQRIHELKDGSLILSLHVSEPREVLWYLVFPWEDGAEIIEPQWLREEAARTAQRIVMRYQKNKIEKD